MNLPECVSVTKAEYLGEYRVSLSFHDGVTGEVDLRDLIFSQPMAEPLRDPIAFAQFFLDGWPTLAWECGFDVAPESLYERATGNF